MKHYFWVLIEKLGVLLLKVASLILLARLLSPSDFGVYAVVAVIVSVAVLLVDSGMGGALIKKQDATDLDYSTVFIYNLVTAAFLYTIVYVSAPAVSQFYSEPRLQLLMRVVGLVIIIRSLGFIQFAKLTKDLKFKRQSFIYILSAAVSLGAAYLLAVAGYGYWALVGQQLLESLLIVGIFWAQSKYFPELRFSWPIFKEHFSFASRLMLSSVVDLVYRNLAVVAAGKSFGIVTAGLYSQASKIHEIFIQVVTEVIDKTSFPILAERVKRPNEFIGYASQLLRLTCLIGFFGVSLLSGEAGLLIDVVLGNQWANSAWMLKVVALSGYGMIVESVTRSILKSQGRSDIIFNLSLLKGAVATCILLALFMLGLNAVLFGLVFISILCALLNMIAVSRTINYTLLKQFSDILVFIIPALIIMAGINALQVLMPDSSVAAFSLSVVGAFFLYVFLLLLAGVQEIFMLKDFLRKLF